MTTGERIKTARKKAGMTQAKLAAISGVAAISIHQYEAGKRHPQLEQALRIAGALGVEWTEFVLPKTNIDPDDEEILKSLLPQMSELDPLTDEEAALKTLLNSIGYNIMKTSGKHFFTFESGGAEISVNDLNELLSCAQNGLKVAAKTLELKLLREAFPFYQTTAAPESPPSAPDGPDTTTAPNGPESAETGRQTISESR